MVAPPPSQQSPLESHLIASVHESLSFYLYENAKWLAERLVALSASEHNVHLLAICYFRANQVYRAYHLLKATGLNSESTRYFYALCCYHLGKLNDAREALCKYGEIPHGAAGFYLLARIYRLTGRVSEAKENYLRALRANPLLWSAYEELCSLGGDDEASEVCAAAAANYTMLMSGGSAGSAEDSQPAGAPADATVVDTAPKAPAGVLHQQQQDRQPQQRMHPVASLFSPMVGVTPAPMLNPFSSSLLATTSTGAPDTNATNSTDDHQAPSTAGIMHIGSDGEASQAPSTAGTSAPSSAATSNGPTGMGVGRGGGMGVNRLLFGTAMATGGPGGPSTSGSNGYASGSGGQYAWQHSPMVPQPLFVTPAGAGPSSVAGLQAFQTGMGTSHMFATPAAGVAVPSTGMLAYGAPAGAGGAGLQGTFVTPAAGGPSLAPPAPPQKGSNAGVAHNHSGAATGTGSESVAAGMFPGFATGAESVGVRTPTAAAGAGGAAAHHHAAPPPHQGRNNSGRMVVDEGKVRKVSGKLFHEPTSANSPSVRRSSRIAALASNHNTVTPLPGGGAHAPAVGHRGGASGASSHPHSQNLPDPNHPPLPPTHDQTLADAKLRQQPVGASSSLNFMFGMQPPQQHSNTLQDPLAHAHVWQQLQLRGLPGGAPSGDGSAAAEPSSSGRALPWMHTKSLEGQAMALALLRFAYEGVRHLCLYRCTEALQALAQLPPSQQRTAWAQCLIGRAYFERMDYHQAAASFEAARQADRHRVEGMELYSTVLWHLKRDYDLSYLAQEMVALDRLAPQAWCAVGNFFSLQREHETSLRLFERALQLEPTFTYAYTLSGHEYFANEDYDKAMACYRNALRHNPRHYNAVYGLGQIYYRQEKYDMALVQFKSAVIINPRSSVLHCYVGMTLAKQGMHDRALGKLQEAIELDPRNPLARYERAMVLVALDACEEALEELQQLAMVAPNEASVFFQMGKLYKRMGDLKAAQHHLERALSFSTAAPGGAGAAAAHGADAALIKAAIEKLGVGDEEEEEEI